MASGPGGSGRAALNTEAWLLWVTQLLVAPELARSVGGGQAAELSWSLCSWFWLFLRDYRSLELAPVWV